MNHDGIAQTLRSVLTAFGSEYQGKQGKTTIDQVISAGPAGTDVGNASIKVLQKQEPTNKLPLPLPITDTKTKSFLSSTFKSKKDKIYLQELEKTINTPKVDSTPKQRPKKTTPNNLKIPPPNKFQPIPWAIQNPRTRHKDLLDQRPKLPSPSRTLPPHSQTSGMANVSGRSLVDVSPSSLSGSRARSNIKKNKLDGLGIVGTSKLNRKQYRKLVKKENKAKKKMKKGSKTKQKKKQLLKALKKKELLNPRIVPWNELSKKEKRKIRKKKKKTWRDKKKQEKKKLKKQKKNAKREAMGKAMSKKLPSSVIVTPPPVAEIRRRPPVSKSDHPMKRIMNQLFTTARQKEPVRRQTSRVRPGEGYIQAKKTASQSIQKGNPASPMDAAIEKPPRAYDEPSRLNRGSLDRSKGTFVPLPSRAKPVGANKVSEIFFDIENTITRDSSGATGRVLQFGAKKLEGDLMISSISERNLNAKKLTHEITKRIHGGKSTFFSSSMLDLGSATKALDLLEKGGMEDLVTAGLLGESDVTKVQSMADVASTKAKPMNARSFLKRELSEYVAGVSTLKRSEAGVEERAYKPAYKKQIPFIGETKHLGAWIESEDKMFNQVGSYFDEASKKGIPEFSGHNIQSHDIPILQERARLHGRDLLQNKDAYTVVDTLSSGSAMQENLNESIDLYKQSDRPRASAISQDRVQKGTGSSGIKSLENTGRMFGLSSGATAEKYQHTSGLHDSNISIGSRVALEYGDQEVKQQALSQYQNIVQESRGISQAKHPSTATKPLKLVPEDQQVSKAVKQQVSGQVQSMRDNIPIQGPTKPKSTTPRPSTSKRASSFGSQLVDEIYGSGTMNEVKSTAKAASQVIDKAISSVGPTLDRHATQADNFFSKLGIKSSKKLKGGTFAAMGVGAVAAGVSVFAASSMFSSGSRSANQPIRPNTTVRSMSADDQEHRMHAPGGPAASSMRHGLTDFGSGYQGFAGSMLGHIKGNLMSRVSLARKGLSGIKEGSAHYLGSVPTSSRQASASAGILRPIEQHAGFTKRSKTPAPPQEIRMSNHSDTLKASKESHGYLAHEAENKKQALIRKKKFVQLSSQGTESLFRSNHNRIGHRQM